jgi:hypothetical protein
MQVQWAVSASASISHSCVEDTSEDDLQAILQAGKATIVISQRQHCAVPGRYLVGILYHACSPRLSVDEQMHMKDVAYVF